MNNHLGEESIYLYMITIYARMNQLIQNNLAATKRRFTYNNWSSNGVFQRGVGREEGNY